MDMEFGERFKTYSEEIRGLIAARGAAARHA
jgi:hypothetical protein